MIPSSPVILVIGYNAFDITVPMLDHDGSFPEVDTKNEVTSIPMAGGGPGATAAMALARLGARVRLVTPLTDDLGGLAQRRELEAAGVDITRSPLLAGQECAKAVILVHPRDGRRTIFWSRGHLPLLPESLWDETWLDQVDLLYLDGHEPHLSLRAADAARARSLPVVLDAGSVREGSAQLVSRCSDVISSRRFAPDLAGTEDVLAALADLRARGPRRVAMTFGSGGVWGLDEEPFAVPAFAVDAVDTTGAGDVFHAGYAFARCGGDDFRHNLRFASATAALKCTAMGGRGFLPTHDQVLGLMATAETLPIQALDSSC